MAACTRNNQQGDAGGAGVHDDRSHTEETR
jgi:hypothetical protein